MTDARAATDARPLTLCVDTATDARSVSVARAARVVSVVREAAARTQSSLLLAEIDEALRAAGVSLGEIELFAVACGPGSFTGLRAGLATVKAFASVHARAVAAVPTLQAVALSAGESARTLALIPAGRGEVFAQAFRVGGDGRVVELDEAAHVNPSSLLRRAADQQGPLKFAGGGARAHAELIRDAARSAGFELIEEAGAEGRGGGFEGDRVWLIARAVEDYAAEIARLSLISYEEGRTVGAHELSALYVRPSDAELNERCHR